MVYLGQDEYCVTSNVKPYVTSSKEWDVSEGMLTISEATVFTKYQTLVDRVGQLTTRVGL